MRVTRFQTSGSQPEPMCVWSGADREAVTLRRCAFTSSR